MVLVLNAWIKATKTCIDLMDAHRAFGGAMESAVIHGLRVPSVMFWYSHLHLKECQYIRHLKKQVQSYFGEKFINKSQFKIKLRCCIPLRFTRT